MIRSIAVIGGGLAGAHVATALRRDGYAGKLIIYGDEPLLPYDRPPLSKVVLSKADAEPSWVFPESAYQANEIELELGSAVSRVEADDSAVMVHTAAGGVHRYDSAVLATGVSPSIPPAWKGVAGVHTLRKWADAVAVREAMANIEHLVIVGGGLIGTEVAAQARQLGLEVTVVEENSAPLGFVVDHDLRSWLVRRHVSWGIGFRTSSRVTHLSADGPGVRMRMQDGAEITAGAVLVSVGSDASCALVSGANGSGVRVDPEYRTANPRIFAVGDVASVVRDGVARRVEHWHAAQEDAVACSRAILGLPALPQSVPWFWSDQGEVRYEMVGACPQNADRHSYSTDQEAFVLYSHEGRVSGAEGIGAARRIRTVRRLMQRAAGEGRDVELTELEDVVDTHEKSSS